MRSPDTGHHGPCGSLNHVGNPLTPGIDYIEPALMAFAAVLHAYLKLSGGYLHWHVWTLALLQSQADPNHLQLLEHKTLLHSTLHNLHKGLTGRNSRNSGSATLVAMLAGLSCPCGGRKLSTGCCRAGDWGHDSEHWLLLLERQDQIPRLCCHAVCAG